MNRIAGTIVLMIKGGAIGVANIIPGVSGGTMAVILGIYDRLIESIARFFDRGSDKASYSVFLLKVFAGGGIAIVLLANLMDYLLVEHRLLTMFAFMGLILGGVPAVIRRHGDMRINAGRIFFFMAGAAAVLGISMMAGSDVSAGAGHTRAVLPQGADSYLMLVLGGFLAGGAMIVPGVSGSFILVLIGQYAVVIASIKEMALLPLAAVAGGAAAGVLVFSKAIELCLEKGPAVTYYFILGLISASFIKLFPGVPAGFSALAAAAASLGGGAVVSFVLSSGRP
jgi:putative membrane protein